MGDTAFEGRASSLQCRDRVARWTIERPEALNAINDDLVADLEQAIEVVREDGQLRALVVTGTDEVFCVGMDLELLERCFADLERFEHFLRRLNTALVGLEQLDLPVIAAVNGLTRAGGFELLLACDLVITADEARISDNHASFGVVPGGGATQRAPRKLGQQRSRELLFTGKWLDGQAAVATGLATRSVPREGLAAAVNELLDDLIDKPRSVLGAIKRAMRLADELPIAQGIDAEIAIMLEHVATSPWGREGFDAFRAGRQPRWNP